MARVEHIRLVVNTAATTGIGSAALTQYLTGKLLAIGLDYHADIDAGTDVTVSVSSPSGPTQTLLTVSNNKTDGWYYPRAGAVSTANSAITDSAVEIPFAGLLSVAVADAGATAHTPGVTVDIFFEV